MTTSYNKRLEKEQAEKEDRGMCVPLHSCRAALMQFEKPEVEVGVHERKAGKPIA